MPACNDNNDIKICLRFSDGETMAQWDNRALIDPRVAGSNPAGDLLIYFQNVFQVLTKTLSAFKSSSQIPHQSFCAQTASLLTPAFGPHGKMASDGCSVFHHILPHYTENCVH